MQSKDEVNYKVSVNVCQTKWADIDMRIATASSR